MVDSAINEVLVLGGTHGNEMSGVIMVQNWIKNPKNFPSSSSFSIRPILSNPEAIRLVRRYKNCDLNRQATPENLAAKITEDTPYEVKRVQELKQIMFGSLDNIADKLVFDLHNTTSNVKCMLIVETEDPLVFHMVKYVQDIMGEDCKVMYTNGQYYSVRALSKHGLGIEVGPQPQGVLRADIYDLQKRALELCLEFLEKYNRGVQFPTSTLTMFEYFSWIKLPRDEDGIIDAVLHPDIQDQDYKRITYDTSIFQKFDGTVLKLRDVATGESGHLGRNETEDLYPIFINEAAYYEKNKSFLMCKRVERKLEAFQLQK